VFLGQITNLRLVDSIFTSYMRNLALVRN